MNTVAPGGADNTRPLIGGEGIEFVTEKLSSMKPQLAIREIQQRCSLQHPLCPPLLGMVDQLGIARVDAHRGVLNAAKQCLLARITDLDKIKLERLLNVSFAFLGIQELREVPMAVMDKLEKVPPVFLKQLTVDQQIFKDLPAKVQRQVWEFDKNLLQHHALAPVGQYKYEVATVMRALAMDEFLPAVVWSTGQEGGAKPSAGQSTAPGRGQGQRAAQAKPRPTGITRKILRKGSRVLQILKEMVGSSQKIYNQIVELCVVKYRDGDGIYAGFKELSYCTLRVQLLMALHDDNNAVSAKDRCHELAWTLDAGIMNGQLTDKHLAKLEKYFADVDAAETQSLKARNLSKGNQGLPLGAPQDEAESAGNASGSVAEPYKVLGDAGTILRDPSAMHLLLAHIIQLTYQGAMQGELPRASQQMQFVLRMIQLAVDSRQMLRDRKYRLPEPDPRIVQDLLPFLATLMLEFEIRGSPAPNDLRREAVETCDMRNGAVQKVLEVLPRSEAARKLTQVFVLERLMRGDYLSATRVLKVLAQTLAPKAVYEVFDFAAALSLRLADMVKEGKLAPTSPMWLYAVDNILVKAVDSHTQVHEEVLRLLLAAAKQLTPMELGQFLQLTLENSKKSRKRGKKQVNNDPLADFPMAITSDVGSDIGSDGWPGILALKVKNSDGVRSVYSQFKSIAGIDEQTAEHLFAYLAEDNPAAV
eukprot:CAMPEP_0202909070 /NCGR_PEP_ID=MMETSP1392-20130828/48159_1 /ASSEMBLY_ACC=CAM_ASM_000868 /TAXON_ID=225041 /ORGANISM="Chlamydomonas chlamydogama, Strain SAG 11-48b" /LENGTH=701 /DNA_ID=CAMNT_0049598681 /DNA_START=412 /DNA_END=2517 /DNA_ORIENTATION=-